AHATGSIGGWDSSRVDEGLTVDGVRKALDAVRANALGELEGRRQLLGAKGCAKRAWWLQLLARGERLCPPRGAHGDPKRGRLTRRLRVREIGLSVLAPALCELHRLLAGSGGGDVTGGGAAAARAVGGTGVAGGTGAAGGSAVAVPGRSVPTA